MIFWMASTFIGFVVWQARGSSVAQYVAVASVMLHFAPYIEELQDTSIHLTVDDAQGDEVVLSRPAIPSDEGKRGMLNAGAKWKLRREKTRCRKQESDEGGEEVVSRDCSKSKGGGILFPC